MSGKTLQVATEMDCVILSGYGRAEQMAFGRRNVGKPVEGQVLIKVMASPINPSDLIFIGGANPNARKLPSVPGFEGSGIVVASGGGEIADALVGRRVSFRSLPDRDGAWAQYAVTEAQRCIPLRETTSFVAGSMFQVNPLTAWTLIDSAQKHGHKAVIQNAAASALGKMVIRFAAERKVEMINIVRRQEQVDLLKALGAKHVLNSSLPDHAENLRKLAKDMSATVAFDAIAGSGSGDLLKLMPRHSELWCYGGLSGEPVQVDPMVLVYEQKAVRGFWGPPTFYGLSKSDFEKGVNEIEDRLDNVFKTEVRREVPLNDFAMALESYQKDMTSGKIVFVMNQTVI